MGNITHARENPTPSPIALLFDTQVIEEQAEASKIENRRGYLGMSSVGSNCQWKEYLNFRWADDAYFGPRTLRKFLDGHEAEPRVFERLRKMDVEIWDLEEDGKQFSCKPLGFGGHFRGHLDGVSKGLPGFDPRQPVLIDVKISEKGPNSKWQALKDVIASGSDNILRDWSPEYWGQANMYMLEYDIMHACYLVFTPGLLDCIPVMVERDLGYAHSLHVKAKEIIFCEDVTTLQRVSTDPECQDCFHCNYSDVCYGNDLPKITCRTCIHATPRDDTEDGLWWCDNHKKNLDDYVPCANGHVYDFHWLQEWATMVDIDADQKWVKYHNKFTKEIFTVGNYIENTEKYDSFKLKDIYSKSGPEGVK